MPRGYIPLPDGKKLVCFVTSEDPDFPSEEINIQETLRADIATYMIVADNVSVANNTNLLSIFNNVSVNKRVRIQRISVYPRQTAENNIVLQVGYINSVPTGGTDALFSRLAADYPPNQTAPAGVISKVLPASPNPIAGINLGGNIISLSNTTGNASGLTKKPLFEVKGNGSALILRPQQDGITIRQVSGGNTGSVTIEVVLTLG